MQTIAMLYLELTVQDVARIQDVCRGDSMKFYREILTTWRNRNAGPNQAQVSCLKIYDNQYFTNYSVIISAKYGLQLVEYKNRDSGVDIVVSLEKVFHNFCSLLFHIDSRLYSSRIILL